MRTAQASRLPGDGTDPEAVIREARRRQRRRHLVAGAVLLAVLAASAAVVITAISPGGHPRRPASRSARTAPAPVSRPLPGLILAGAATTVVMWPVGRPVFTYAGGGPPAYVADLTTGHLSRRQVPGIAGCDCLPYLIGAGPRLVYVSADGTAVIPADLAGKPRMLGTTPFFAPAAAPGHVWLVRYRGGVLGRAPVRVRLVPVTGGPPGAAVTLPAGDLLIRGTDAGLLLVARRGLALWAPGSAPANLPHSSGWDGFDATSLLVVYGTGCDPHYDRCQMLRIFNVVTSRLVSLPAPPGTAGWVPAGFDLVSAISPDNQMIAAYAATRPKRNRQARLYVIRLTSPNLRARAVPSSAAPYYTSTAWSAKGSWLLYQGARGHLWAYQVTTGKIRTSSTPCCGYTAMVAVPNRPG